MKMKMEEFEDKCSKLKNESNARLRDAEEAQLKTMKLQETIER